MDCLYLSDSCCYIDVTAHFSWDQRITKVLLEMDSNWEEKGKQVKKHLVEDTD